MLKIVLIVGFLAIYVFIADDSPTTDHSILLVAKLSMRKCINLIFVKMWVRLCLLRLKRRYSIFNEIITFC